MKLLSLTIFALILTLDTTAQNRIAIFAGPQATTALYKVEEVKQKTSMKYGFQLGGNMKIPFENRLFFSPTVFYSMKGYKVKFTRYASPPDLDATDNDVTIHTFEIAPLLQIDFSKDPAHFFIKFGPSLDVQLFGKESFHLMSTGATVNRNMKFGFADYGFVSMNGIAQFGFETSTGFSIFAQYNFGIGSINNADYGPKIYHRVAGISVGKYLNRK
ncbi:MAG: porin family protein [Chitinophagaceae bacterium]